MSTLPHLRTEPKRSTRRARVPAARCGRSQPLASLFVQSALKQLQQLRAIMHRKNTQLLSLRDRLKKYARARALVQGCAGVGYLPAVF